MLKLSYFWGYYNHKKSDIVTSLHKIVQEPLTTSTRPLYSPDMTPRHRSVALGLILLHVLRRVHWNRTFPRPFDDLLTLSASSCPLVQVWLTAEIKWVGRDLVCLADHVALDYCSGTLQNFICSASLLCPVRIEPRVKRQVYLLVHIFME